MSEEKLFKVNKSLVFSILFSSLWMDKKIVIVGGGIIGCSTAYYLTKLGHKD